MSNDLDKKLKVFKTMTVMLANLSRTAALVPTDNLQLSQWSPQQRQVLKVSDALAQLLVSQHEVVAVSTNLFGPGLTMVACADQTETQTKAKSSPISLETIWNLVFTRNSRSTDPAQEHPTIIAAEKPHDLGSQTAIEYMESLLVHWRVLVLCIQVLPQPTHVLCHRTQPSSSTHLWILSQALMESVNNGNEVSRGTFTSALFRYIAAMSCQKMLRRITHERVSEPYFQFLKNVDVPILPIPSKSFPIPSASRGTARDKVEEEKNDRLLLDFILVCARYKSLDTDFPKIPNLLALAKSPIFPIYNNDISAEFHMLLLALLERFKKALATLTSCVDQGGSVVDAATDTQLYGYGLLKLARGHAFRMHTEHIGHWLKKPDPTKARAPVPASSNAEDTVEDTVEDLEDEDLQALKPLPNRDNEGAAPKTLTKSVDWLRLMVAHFDAVEIIIQHIWSPHFLYSEISAMTLVAPSTSAALCPWEEVVDGYLPEPDAASVPSLTTSNTDLSKFLRENRDQALLTKNISPLVDEALTLWNRRDNPDFSPRVLHGKLLEIGAFVGQFGGEGIRRITSDVLIEASKQWKKDKSEANTQKVTSGIQDLHDRFFHIPPGASFFSNLDNMKFKGTMHCEACLATLIYNATKPAPDDDVYSEVLKRMAVIVSPISFLPSTLTFFFS